MSRMRGVKSRIPLIHYQETLPNRLFERVVSVVVPNLKGGEKGARFEIPSAAERR